MACRFADSATAAGPACDVVVIGGGIVGLASAFFLGRQGLRVTIVERYAALATLASGRSGEGVRAQWELPQNIEIVKASIAQYERFGELVGDPSNDAGLRQIGYLYASRTEAGAHLLTARVARQRSGGLDDVELLDGPSARRRFPELSPATTAVAFRQKDGVVSVRKIMAGYLHAADATIVLDAEATALRETPLGVAVETSRGTVEAAAAIVASGPLSGRLLAPFGGVPIRAARASIAYVTVEGVPPGLPVTIDVDVGSFWRPDAGGARITSSFSGTRFVEDFTEEPIPEPGYVTRAIRSVAPLSPFWNRIAPNIVDSHVRSGVLSVTPDGGPLIGRQPGTARIFVHGGYGGHGVMASLEGAKRLARMVAAPRDDDARNPFAPSRFVGGRDLELEPMTLNLASR